MKERRRAALTAATALIFALILNWGYQNSRNRVVANDRASAAVAQEAKAQSALGSATSRAQALESQVEILRADEAVTRQCLAVTLKEVVDLRLAARYLASTQVSAPNVAKPSVTRCKPVVSPGKVANLVNAAYEANNLLNAAERSRHPQVLPRAVQPSGATARCRDGTYSHSQHASGTCSYHGGVAVWLTIQVDELKVTAR